MFAMARERNSSEDLCDAGLVGGEPGLRPIVGLQMEFGNGIALLARDQIDLRQKLAISRALSIEVPGRAPQT